MDMQGSQQWTGLSGPLSGPTVRASLELMTVKALLPV